MIDIIHSYSGILSAWICGLSGFIFLIMHLKVKFRNEKYLMLIILNIYFMRKKIDLENIISI